MATQDRAASRHAVIRLGRLKRAMFGLGGGEAVGSVERRNTVDIYSSSE